MMLLMNSFFEAHDLFEVATQPFDTLSTPYLKGAADTQQLIFVELTLIAKVNFAIGRKKTIIGALDACR